jgi:hypothetical protein
VDQLTVLQTVDGVSQIDWKKSGSQGILAGWQAAYGPLNFSTVPIAGWNTLQQKSSIQTSILAASTVRFAAARSTHGPALVISSIGRS